MNDLQYNPPVEDVVRVVESAWEVLVGGSVERSRAVALPGGPETTRVSGSVSMFTDDYELIVQTEFAPDCGEALAESMFGSNSGEISEEQIREAAGEFTNVVAGNIRGLHRESMRTSLPDVVSGSELEVSFQGAIPSFEQIFEVDSSLLYVGLFER